MWGADTCSENQKELHQVSYVNRDKQKHCAAGGYMVQQERLFLARCIYIPDAWTRYKIVDLT